MKLLDSFNAYSGGFGSGIEADAFERLFTTLRSGISAQKSDDVIAEELAVQLVTDKLRRGVMFPELGLAENIFQQSGKVNEAAFDDLRLLDPQQLATALHEHHCQDSQNILPLRQFVFAFKYDTTLRSAANLYVPNKNRSKMSVSMIDSICDGSSRKD